MLKMYPVVLDVQPSPQTQRRQTASHLAPVVEHLHVTVEPTLVPTPQTPPDSDDGGASDDVGATPHLKNGGPLREHMHLCVRSGTVLARDRQAAGNKSGLYAQNVVRGS